MLPYAIPMCSVAPAYDYGLLRFVFNYSPTRVLAAVSSIVSLDGSFAFAFVQYVKELLLVVQPSARRDVGYKPSLHLTELFVSV